MDSRIKEVHDFLIDTGFLDSIYYGKHEELFFKHHELPNYLFVVYIDNTNIVKGYQNLVLEEYVTDGLQCEFVLILKNVDIDEICCWIMDRLFCRVYKRSIQKTQKTIMSLLNSLTRTIDARRKTIRKHNCEIYYDDTRYRLISDPDVKKYRIFISSDSGKFDWITLYVGEKLIFKKRYGRKTKENIKNYYNKITEQEQLEDRTSGNRKEKIQTSNGT